MVTLTCNQHRTTATLVSVSDDGREIGTSRVCDSVGWAQLTRRWADAIAAESVRTNRFDPLHNGASEQALHDQLIDAMTNISQNGRADIELHGGAPPLQITQATASDWTHALSSSLVADVADSTQIVDCDSGKNRTGTAYRPDSGTGPNAQPPAQSRHCHSVARCSIAAATRTMARRSW